MYYLYSAHPSSFQTGWFMESLATQTLVIHVIRTRFTPIVKSSAGIWLWLTTIFSVTVGWIIPYTAAGKFFRMSPLPLNVVAVLALVVIVYLVTVEAGKRIYYRRLAKAA
jgi:Mg2+-importing ATPase